MAAHEQPVDILVHSTKLSLSDDKGNPFATSNSKVTITAPTAAASQAAQVAGIPDLTLNIRRQASKPQAMKACSMMAMQRSCVGPDRRCRVNAVCRFQGCLPQAEKKLNSRMIGGK